MNHKKLHRARNIIVAEEVEERHIKRLKIPTHIMKVDLEEENQRNLLRSRKLKKTSNMNPNRTVIK